MKQTVRIGGKRTIITTKNGKVTTKDAPPLEWHLQAAQVRRLKNMPEYVRDAADARPGTFTLAGDMNSGRRGPTARTQALATGLAPGEHDLRIYMHGGRLGLIENKVGGGKLSNDQKTRHALLEALGFGVQAVIRANSEDEAADIAEATVRGWLGTERGKLAA